MADLIQIQYEVVDKGKSLKTAFTGVERMEKALTKLSKQIVAGTTTQDRQRKALIAYGRELKRLTGMTGNQAYGAVVKYTNAVIKQTIAEDNATAASQRLARVQEYLASRQNRATASTLRQNSALKTATGAMNQYGRVSAIGGKRMNRTNMIIQQSGYQFQDFAVQIQGGTNAFVALGQQGSQLLGVFGPAGAVLGAFLAVGTAIARMKTAGSELSFDFKRFGADIAKSLEPIKPILSAIGSAFSAVGEVLSGAANFIVQNLSRIITVAITAGAAFGTYFAAGVIKAALSVKTLSKALLFLRNNLIKTGIGALVVAAGLLVHEFMRVVKAVGSFGAAFNMVWEASKEIFNRLVNLVEFSFYAMVQAGANFTTDTLISIKSLIVNYGEGFNQIGAMTKGLIAGIKALFMQLPKAVGDQAKLAANSFIDGMEALANGALGAINRVIAGFKELANSLGADKVMEFFGIDTGILKELGKVDLSKYKSDTSDAGKTLGETFAEAYKEAFDQSAENKPFLETINIAIASTMDLFRYLEQPLKDAKALFMAPTPELEKLLEAIGKGEKSVDDLASYFTLVKEEEEDAAKAAEKFRKELEAPMVKAIDSVSNAFGDFIANGLKDFKGFASSILDSFKNMIAQMIATASRNKIMLSLELGGVGFAKQAAAGQVVGIGSAGSGSGMIGSAIGSFANGGAAGSGFLGGFGAAMPSSLGGAGNGLFAVKANAAAANGGLAASIGALAAPLLAVTAAFSFLRTRTKELDSGLRVTVDNMDVLVKSFKTIQKSRFFGLSKKVRTSEEEASSGISDPIVNAVVTIQESVMEAASAFGVASDKFNDFTYDFEVSLKGLTEDQKVEKLNEEFAKLGDTFTEMSGLFNNMNDLMAVYQQRLELEKQLLVAQGDVVKLREQELETIHVLNRDLATRLHLLQAEGDMQSALTAFASGISEQQGIIRRAVDALVKPLQDAIDRTRTQAEKSYSIFKTAADKSVDSAKNIVDIITSALDSRTIISESAELMRYQTAQKQLASFAGGSEFDEASLRKATEGVSIDSQKFFGSFEDYARDFYRTQINLEDLAAVAEKELSEVEQQIDIAEKAYQVAMGTYQEAQDFNVALNNLLFDLALYNDVTARNQPFIDQIKQSGESQVAILEQLLEATILAFNPDASAADLVGNIMDVADAMGILKVTDADLDGAVVPTKEDSAGDIGSHMEGFDATLSKMYSDLGIDIETLKKLPQKLLDSEFFAPLAKAKITESFSDVDLTSTLLEKATDLANKAKEVGVEIFNADATIETFTTTTNTAMGNLGEKLETALTGDGGLSSFIDQLKNSINGEGGLGSIVGSLTDAVNSLASSNNNLATAQQKAASASKISTITTNAAGISADIANLESSRGTTATGATPTQEIELAKLQADLSENANLDGEDKNQNNWHFQKKINKLNEEIASQVVASELSPEDAASLATLLGNLETMRQEVTDLGGTPTFATGGYHPGGMRMVGENGPELEVTGPSRIYSAQQTKNMLSGGSGEVVVELRSLRREVSELKAEQRKVGVENVKYNKKSYDLYREWDTVGLPATRTA